MDQEFARVQDRQLGNVRRWGTVCAARRETADSQLVVVDEHCGGVGGSIRMGAGQGQGFRRDW